MLKRVRTFHQWIRKTRARFYSYALGLLLINLLITQDLPEGFSRALMEYFVVIAAILLVLHALLTFAIDILKKLD